MRQSRNYAALQETQHQIDEAPSPATRQPRNYDAVRDTQHQVDRDAATASPKRPDVQRSWTHLGGMVPQQHSANLWHKQNNEILMSEERDTGAGREGEGTQPSQPGRDQNDPELQEARAAVEEARRREAAERARLQERERGPER